MKDLKQHARDALQRAIDKAVSQAELARRISELAGRPVETGHIYYWLTSGSIPTDACVAIEASTGVKREDLRPDDYWRHWPDLKAPTQVKPSKRPREEQSETAAAGEG